jgi:hypothetical protein
VKLQAAVRNLEILEHVVEEEDDEEVEKEEIENVVVEEEVEKEEIENVVLAVVVIEGASPMKMYRKSDTTSKSIKENTEFNATRIIILQEVR